MVGADGRAHALAHVLGRSAQVVVTPGNPGIPGSVESPPEDLEADLFVISPEGPLVEGLADRLRGRGRRVFGPGADGAHLEGSKAWMKELVAEAGVPTARYGVFDDPAPALAFLRSLDGPWVVKTDGLTGGKGVLVTDSLRLASEDVRAKLDGTAFGEAGRTVVIEEGLVGAELSLLALCDGRRAVPLAPARDYKRLADGDDGPNTGGMGAYSPVPDAGEDLLGDVMDRFVEPTLWALRRRGIDYRGTLYAGLMLARDGPRLLEYNVRFGDPEAQVVLPRLTADLADLLAGAADGHLPAEPTFDQGAAVTVVCASAGYPGEPDVGQRIHGLADVAELDGVTVYHAGVALDRDGELVNAGGRVLSLVGRAGTLAEARARAYEGVDRVTWTGMQHRRDIAGDHASGRLPGQGPARAAGRAPDGAPQPGEGLPSEQDLAIAWEEALEHDSRDRKR